jgi:tetratricopeptide (TPR) repeat protein
MFSDEQSFQTWIFYQLLLKKSLEAGFDNPAAAVRLAQLAVNISLSLGAACDPRWILDLQARAYAYLGNARRVLGELRNAETAFRKAETLLAHSMTGDSLIAAEILHLKCSLRRDQRRLEEALDLAVQALSLYEELRDLHGVGVVLLKKANILEERGQLEDAVSLLRVAIARLDTAEETQLSLYARHNLTLCLSMAGQCEEAECLFSEIRGAFESWAKPLDLVRLRWTKGKIDCGRERFEAAEAAFRQVQQEFLRRDMGFDAALVSLDLMVVYAQQHRLDELKQLALEIAPIFESRDVHREAIATLVMLQ